MHSTFSSSPVQTRSQQFLIPPFQRLPFTLLFVLATGLGAFLVAFALRQVQILGLPTLLQASTLPGMFVHGLVSGLMVGAVQWFVLQRYLADWLWILATTTGYVIFMVILQAWGRLLEQFLLSHPFTSQLAATSPLTFLAIGSVLGSLVAAVCAVWLGIAQWLVLRQYTRNSWGWILVPPIAVAISAALAGFNIALANSRFPLQIDTGVLSAGILGTVQAIALCSLKKASANHAVSVNRILATAPEILNYQQVQQLAQRLQVQINQAWLNEVPTSRPLKYLVGVNEMGAIAAYEPLNQSALDSVTLTPLPALTDTPPLENGGLPPLAHFQVTFLPSGSLQIIPWRGIPLLWLGLGMILLVLLISIFAGFLAGKLPGL